MSCVLFEQSPPPNLISTWRFMCPLNVSVKILSSGEHGSDAKWLRCISVLALLTPRALSSICSSSVYSMEWRNLQTHTDPSHPVVLFTFSGHMHFLLWHQWSTPPMENTDYCLVFRRFPKLRKGICPYVRMEQLGSHWTDFHEIWYLSIFSKSVEKIQV